jgi:TonB-dependent starch-binding outer membrane protein SusC
MQYMDDSGKLIFFIKLRYWIIWRKMIDCCQLWSYQRNGSIPMPKIRNILRLLVISATLFYPGLLYSQLVSTQTITGAAVDTLSSKNFNRGFISSVPELFHARVSGLIVSRPGSDPDEFADIRFRGLTSINSRTSPLFVIDGFVTENFDLVDPEDIASIEFLKDAASSARYGIRGNAGIIRINTKSGSGSPHQRYSVNYHTQASMSVTANRQNVLNADQYRQFSATAAPSPGTDFGSSTNWQDEVSRAGISHLHHLSVSGRNSSTAYRFSGTFRNIESIQKGAGNRELGGRFNLTHHALENRLKLRGGLSLINRDADNGLGEVFRYAATFNPTAPILNDDGSYFEVPVFDQFNPVSILDNSVLESRYTRTSVRLSASADLDDVINGLSANVLYGRELNRFSRGEYYGRDLRFRGEGRNGLAYIADSDLTNNYFETALDHLLSLNRVSIETTAGYNWQSFNEAGQFVSGGNFSSDELRYYNLSFARDFNDGLGQVSSFRGTHKVIAFFGESRVSLNNTFFGSLIIRHEGSSRLGDNNRWGTFYGASAAVDWTRIATLNAFESLITRISYGKTGQDAPFDGLSRLRFSQSNPMFTGTGYYPTISSQQNPNPDLKWEEKREMNAGIDAALMDGRLEISADYFNNQVSDLIMEVTLPSPPATSSLTWINIGEIRNHGFEFKADLFSEIGGRIAWNTGIRFGLSRSTLVSLSNDEVQFSGSQIVTPGAPGMGNAFLILLEEGGKIGNFWGPRFAGFSPEGNWQFFNSVGQVVPYDQIMLNDYSVIGNGLPDFTLGWSNRFQYSGWDLDMFWQGAFGHDMVNINHLFYQNPSVLPAYNITTDARDLTLRQFPFYSDYYVEDASYFRLSNLTLGYTFSFSGDRSLSSARIYLSGNNLWTLTSYSGVDPEVRLSTFFSTDNASRAQSRSVLAPGIERRNIWPTQTTLLAGLQIQF